MTASSKYRSRAIADNVIAFSISYQRENMLARGMGLEHLRELLIRLARPLLRQGASLAYGGHWKETEDNFIYPLLTGIIGVTAQWKRAESNATRAEANANRAETNATTSSERLWESRRDAAHAVRPPGARPWRPPESSSLAAS